ncbi:unnamed protein product [Phytophthora fragariaefolia]|uniref:Unnamed protein product n=1 Tax=Phytophthora fragariaefolia TaxID=1490495 RepID=A0A9W6XVG0_9STRA|nr:unnamed protein product [Phytophthora fragariaefolia]
MKDIRAAVNPDPLFLSTTDVLVIIRSVQFAQPLGTQGEQKRFSWGCIAPMVREPGSSGGSQSFYRESTEEDVKIKTDPENELSTEEGLPPTTWKTPGSGDRQTVGRRPDDEGSAMNLEEKLRPPPPGSFRGPRGSRCESRSAG